MPLGEVFAVNIVVLLKLTDFRLKIFFAMLSKDVPSFNSLESYKIGLPQLLDYHISIDTKLTNFPHFHIRIIK